MKDVRLKEVVANPTDRSDGTLAPYLALEHIAPGQGALLPGAEPREEVRTDSIRCQPGDVLFGKLRPYLAKVVQISSVATCSSELLVLRPDHRFISSDFLYYLCLSAPFVSWSVATSEGVKMPRTDWEAIANFRIPELPSLEDQQRITASLRAACSNIGKLTAEQERLGMLVREKSFSRQSELALRGVLGGELVEAPEPWMGRIPQRWRVARLKYEARLESGHTPSRSRPELWNDCTIPWISLNDVGAMAQTEFLFETTNLISEAGLAASSARVLPAGTVALSRDATIGRTAILGVPMATSQHFADWVCGPDLEPRYLWLLFRTAMQTYFDSLTDGATLRTIGMGDLRNFTIPLPPRDEQERIVDEAEKIRTSADALLAELEDQTELLAERKRAIVTDGIFRQGVAA